MLGNYAAVIAVCGMVAEMLAIFLWELSSVKLDEKLVFGCKFKKLRQERRVKMLQLSKNGKRATGWIDRAPSHAATSNSLSMN